MYEVCRRPWLGIVGESEKSVSIIMTMVEVSARCFQTSQGCSRPPQGGDDGGSAGDEPQQDRGGTRAAPPSEQEGPEPGGLKRVQTIELALWLGCTILSWAAETLASKCLETKSIDRHWQMCGVWAQTFLGKETHRVELPVDSPVIGSKAACLRGATRPGLCHLAVVATRSVTRLKERAI